MKTIKAKSETNIATLLFMFILMLIPQSVSAQNGEFDTPKNAFSWYSTGQGCMHLKIKVCNESPRRTLHDATFGVRYNGKEEEILYVNETKSDIVGISQSQMTPKLDVSESFFYLTNDNVTRPLLFIPQNGNEHQVPGESSVVFSNAYLEFDWYYPVRYAGKTMELYIKGARLWDGDNQYDISYPDQTIGTITFNSISVETYDFIPGYQSADYGTVKIPVSSSNKINKIDAYYTDQHGNSKRLATTTFQDNTYNGFVTLPSTEIHKDLTLVINVVSGAPNADNHFQSDWPKACSGNDTIRIAASNDRIIHAPLFLTATMQNDFTESVTPGDVLLKWQTRNMGYKDLFEGDAFIIQRSLTGRDADYKDIGSVELSATDSIYSFYDETLISSLEAKHIDRKIGIPLVRYRVVRASASKLWGFDHNPAVAYAHLPIGSLCPLQPCDVFATWNSKDKREVKVSWKYEPKTMSRQYVYDKRANIKLAVRSFNKQNVAVDSTFYILSFEEIRKRNTTITLNRSCVNYSISIEYDKGTSPIARGTGDIFSVISDKDSYYEFADRVNSGDSTRNAVLISDVSDITTIIGSKTTTPYAGKFIGNGHSVSFKLISPYTPGGMFNYLSDEAAIYGLTVNGEIHSMVPHTGSIAGQVLSGSVFIENCYSTVSVGCTSSSRIHSGGLIGGMADLANTIHITNSYFAGQLKANGSVQTDNGCGGLLGWKPKQTLAVLHNNYVNIDWANCATKTSRTFVVEEADNFLRSDYGFNSYKVGAWYATISQGYQSETTPTGDGWDHGYPDAPSFSYVTPDSTYSIQSIIFDDRFYYENLGHIDKSSLAVTALQSSAVLTWKNESEEPVDYYEVWRRDANSTTFERIATQLSDMEYEDKTTSPVHTYYYYVRGVNNCEGTKYDDTNPVEGCCYKWGKVEGYLRFPDGTGIPGVEIIIQSTTNAYSFTATTDESGYYSHSGISYVDNKETTYNVSVNFNGFSESRPVTFTTVPQGNSVSDVNFTITKCVRFSGLIQYKGTSIPVPGVGFLLDGRQLHTASGKVLSDHEGQFSFYMTPGNHTIQAVKDGHTFWKNGFYYEDDTDTSDSHNFVTDKALAMFYDETRVKLIGRVVGGDDQGDLPLGNSLSRNNLGDNLQMVLTLEGDNKSRLVWDIQNTKLKEREEEFKNPSVDNKYEYKTTVQTSINRMVVTPDIHTGEFVVWLPPVKWKIQQITAQGYATLFQDGQNNDVIDLSDSLTLHTDRLTGKWYTADKKEINTVEVSYHAQYSRIYHTPVILDYQQVNFTSYNYFGELNYTARDLTGQESKVAIAYTERKPNWPEGKKDSLNVKYTFGYPIFRIDRPYTFNISASERYYYNNNKTSDTIDVVYMSRGAVTIQNGFVSNVNSEKIYLDSLGQATYTFKPVQSTYMLAGTDALNTITMSLRLNGTNYEATPLHGYVFQTAKKTGAKDYVSVGTPLCIDVLRDPPGATSRATLSKGSVLKYSYNFNWSVKFGMNFSFGFGNSANTWAGIGVGTYTKAGSTATLDIGIIGSEIGTEAYSYTMTTTEDISTSSNTNAIGAEADLYIGVETAISMTPSIAIMAVPHSMWKQMGGTSRATMIEIARGFDAKGDTIHLIRDEMVVFGPTVNSSFVLSQHHILRTVIPGLEKQCSALMFNGTLAEAQAAAKANNEIIYWSLRSPDDPNYAVRNTMLNSSTGENEYFYNTTITQAADGINYMIVKPESLKDDTTDRISQLGSSVVAWAKMIADNEKAKLSVSESDKVKTYDMDGRSSVTYGEEFTSDFSYTREEKMPWNGYLNPSTLLTSWVASILKQVEEAPKNSDQNPSKKLIEADAFGFKFGFQFTPVLEYNTDPIYGAQKKYSRKESFTISMDLMSHLIFDVYRQRQDIGSTTANGDREVFTNANYLTLTKDVISKVKNEGIPLVTDKQLAYSRGFIYRTRGGATCRPYESGRSTIFYQPDTELDAATRKIENPVLRIDCQSLSGIPMGSPARFKLYMTNDSEEPQSVYPFFNLQLVDGSNPGGARVVMDGMSITGIPRQVEIYPGKVVEKVIEVYPSETFDYENLRLRLVSQGDIYDYDEVQFSAHFLPSAGNITISSPGDKWVMNTDAPYDQKYGWYLPVTIGGFVKTQTNFDHIEFQYKESNRGDDYWTNLCGFYADSTIYQAASGTKEMIPSNGNIVTRFFGEGYEIEKGYDLRAVLFCRNGNSFITSSSQVLSGVKDTRRPRLFGTPEPKDGILGAGDNIVFNFSENIEYNYLQQATNFEVKGETNETSISEEPSLYFSGTGSYAETTARRNFTDKNFTIEVMIKPEVTGAAMPFFSHGRDGNYLQLSVTPDRYIELDINGFRISSEQQVPTDQFTRVALSVDNEHRSQTLVVGQKTQLITGTVYSGYGPLTFGSSGEIDVSKRTFFKGRMLQARVWGRDMDLTLLNSYGNQLLTGYEMGLTDYYPMNDGKGTYAADLAQGAHLQLHGATWALPRGMSLHLDWSEQKDVKGLQLKPEFLQRSATQDYTLMFWFKTNADGRGALLCNGSGRTTDVSPSNKFFIGFEGEDLKYRTNGAEYLLGKTFSDDSWHHYAMTVNRSHNVASIYVDNNLKAQFATDTLGGMTGNFYVGNMVWYEEGAHNDVLHQSNALTGNIDGITLFKQALPPTLIERYTSKALGGTESGLVTYIDFDHQERQSTGSLALKPYAYNKVVLYDLNGNPTDKHDSVFVEPVATIENHIDQTLGAPIQAYEELRNLNFSFVGRDNQLLVGIDELNTRINKRRVYVTINEIPDLNGNYMASPYTATVFVDRNPLRWESKNYKNTISSASLDDYSFDVKIVNNSGADHTYTITNLPKWLSTAEQTDVIEAQGQRTITFNVSQDVNVGTYDYIIYLTDENGLAEPLYLNITIEGIKPGWALSDAIKQYSMSIVGRLFIGSDIVTDSRDIVGVFDNLGRCLGLSNPNYDASSAESLVYLTVYDSITTQHPLIFKLWHYETGKTMVLTPSETVTFKPETFVGTTQAPLVLTAGSQYIQSISLYPGWNWISLNVTSNEYRNVPKLLSNFVWKEGDMLSDETNNISIMYRGGQWISNKGSKALSNLRLSVSRSYRVKVSDNVDVELTGYTVKNQSDRTIQVHQGWNSIGYTPMVNLPIATALTDYLDNAKDGDVIKSKNEFAMFYDVTGGSRGWKGNLKYMKPGEGYMLYRKAEGTVTFSYPYYEPNISFFDTPVVVQASANKMSALTKYPTTMSLTAQVSGVSLQPGDSLMALYGAQIVGATSLDAESSADSLLYMSIEGSSAMPLTFVIQREGQIVAVSPQTMQFITDGIIGTPEQPTSIQFAPADLDTTDVWYSVQGIRLQQRPVSPGVYIHNGQKVIIK